MSPDWDSDVVAAAVGVPPAVVVVVVDHGQALDQECDWEGVGGVEVEVLGLGAVEVLGLGEWLGLDQCQ